jgi:hypothetical protein
VLGFEYKEEEIVRRSLQALPPRFEQIATSIEMLVDLETITVDELIGRLKPSEERINRDGDSAIASLNLTEDELIAKITSRLKIAGGGNTDQQKGCRRLVASADEVAAVGAARAQQEEAVAAAATRWQERALGSRVQEKEARRAGTCGAGGG